MEAVGQSQQEACYLVRNWHMLNIDTPHRPIGIIGKFLFDDFGNDSVGERRMHTETLAVFQFAYALRQVFLDFLFCTHRGGTN